MCDFRGNSFLPANKKNLLWEEINKFNQLFTKLFDSCKDAAGQVGGAHQEQQSSSFDWTLEHFSAVFLFHLHLICISFPCVCLSVQMWLTSSFWLSCLMFFSTTDLFVTHTISSLLIWLLDLRDPAYTWKRECLNNIKNINLWITLKFIITFLTTVI